MKIRSQRHLFQNDRSKNMEIDPSIPQNFFSLKTVADRYGITTRYLYKLRYDRKLSHYTLGERIFIDINELEALIRQGKKPTN